MLDGQVVGFEPPSGEFPVPLDADLGPPPANVSDQPEVVAHSAVTTECSLTVAEKHSLIDLDSFSSQAV